jgi:hypothetical protein
MATNMLVNIVRKVEDLSKYYETTREIVSGDSDKFYLYKH